MEKDSNTICIENKNIFIVRCGEVALKGMNKPYFERMLVERIKNMLKRHNFLDTYVKRYEGLIFVYAPMEYNKEDVIRTVRRVFGVASISYAVECNSNMEDIAKTAIDFIQEEIDNFHIKTFKVQAKRADKNFPVKSPDISRQIGASILKAVKVLSVDVHNPDCFLFIDVRHDKTYIYKHKIQGVGGLPLGTNGKGMVLLSGGIDSPVASYMMAKRGMALEAVHFHSYPYTSPRAQEKVERLASLVASYSGSFKMHVINLLPIQEEIVKNCPTEQTTILVRRFMVRIANELAKKSNSMMLITGENLGQVASQTAESIVVTDAVCDIPIMRPLIGMDKIEIMDLAKEIGTYETSIEPYEDCCTVFLPKHPVTKPTKEKIEEAEQNLDVQGLVDAAVKSDEIVNINC